MLLMTRTGPCRRGVLSRPQPRKRMVISLSEVFDRSAWRNHVLPAWGQVPVSDVRETAVQQWISEMTLGDTDASPPRKPKGATLVIRAYGVLAAILDDAVSDRRTLSNPARGVALPRKLKKPHVYLSHEQVHALAAASKYPALVLVLAYCGLRWGEATGLRSSTWTCSGGASWSKRTPSKSVP